MKNFCINCASPSKQIVKNICDGRFGISGAYSIVKCSTCGLEQTSPVPDQQTLASLYAEYYNFSGERNTRYTRFRAFFLNSFFYKIWMMLDGDTSFHDVCGRGKLLDVGCNEGRGLRIYQDNGYRVEGLELNPRAAETARKNGFAVYGELLENLASDLKYDVIVLSNVLEHSLHPAEMVQHIHRHLQPEGEVWISCPNSESWLRGVFSRSWINWHVPFHIVHFSSRTLGSLLEKNGFEIVYIKNATPALWVAHSVLSSLFAKPGLPTRQLRSVTWVAGLVLLVRGVLFPLLWLGNVFGRGDCLIVVARRR